MTVSKMVSVGPPYASVISQIATGCGPISPRAVVGIGSFYAWPGVQTFWSYQGNVQPLPCPVQDWFYSLVNRSMVGRVFGSPNPAFSELFFDWADEGSLECNRYIAFNFADPAHPWIIGVRERTAADPSGTMDYPVLGGSFTTAGATYGALFLHEYGWTENGIPRAPLGLIYAESGDIVAGEGDKRLHVTQLVFDAEGPPDALGYRFFPREQPHDAASEYDTGLYTIVHGGRIDVRFSGGSVRLRMEATSDGPWGVGRPRLEMKAGGRSLNEHVSRAHMKGSCPGQCMRVVWHHAYLSAMLRIYVHGRQFRGGGQNCFPRFCISFRIVFIRMSANTNIIGRVRPGITVASHDELPVSRAPLVPFSAGVPNTPPLFECKKELDISISGAGSMSDKRGTYFVVDQPDF